MIRTALLALAFAAVQSAAHADITKYVLSGDVFGTPASLTFLDDSTRGESLDFGSNFTQTGGDGTGFTNPISSILNLNGQIYAIGENDAGSHGGFADSGRGTNEEEIDIFSSRSVSDVSASFGADIIPGADYASYGTYYYSDSRGTIQGTIGDLKITETTVSSAPEPGVWALMLSGVGALGLFLRWRRSPEALTA